MAEPEVKKGWRFRNLEKLVRNPARPLKRIGAFLASAIQASFPAQRRFGKTWDERAVPNIPAAVEDLTRGPRVKSSRFEERPVLQDLGRLTASINWRLLSENTVQVGTNLPYASIQHFGGVRVVPVPQAAKVNLRTWLSTTLGRPWTGSFSWLLGVNEFKWKILPRPYVGIEDGEIETIRAIILEELVNPRVRG